MNSLYFSWLDVFEPRDKDQETKLLLHFQYIQIHKSHKSHNIFVPQHLGSMMMLYGGPILPGRQNRHQ